MTTVTFNGVVLTNRFIVGDQKRPLPEFRVSSMQVDGADGEVYGGSTIGPRFLSFRVTSIDREPRQVQDDAKFLMQTLAVRQPTELAISDERSAGNTQLVRYVVPTGSFDMDEYVRAGSWVLQFVQPDPYLYGHVRTQEVASDATVETFIDGNAPSEWTLHAVPNSTTGAYTFEYGENAVVFDGAFDGAMALVVDSRTGAVNTGAAGNGLTNATTIEPIQHGTVTLKSIGGPATFQWRPRWL
jgi:predicted phage tail component-like protein